MNPPMTQSQMYLALTGITMGFIHDLQCYRRSRNEARSNKQPDPDFDWLCMFLHMSQGLMAGLGVGSAVHMVGQ